MKKPKRKLPKPHRCKLCRLCRHRIMLVTPPSNWSVIRRLFNMVER